MPGFLIGIVVGAVAASAYLKRKETARMGAATLGARRGSANTEGRVDELSSAASMASPETARINAGDGTPSSSASSSSPSAGMGVPMGSSVPGSATGLSESRH
jgi:hypothetical protein